MSRLVVVVVAAVSLIAVSLGSGAVATLAGKGELIGAGTSYRFRLTNTGDVPIKCWRLTFRVGVKVTAFGTAPAGWQLGAPGPLPREQIGGRSDAGIPPGGSADFLLTTDTTFPTVGTDALSISTDCKVDTGATVSGPTPGGSTPPPGKTPCTCKSLTVRVDGDTTRRASRLFVVIRWSMHCTPGSGNCTGALVVTPPPGSKFVFDTRGEVNDAAATRDEIDDGKFFPLCKGPCDKTTKRVRFFMLNLARKQASARTLQLSIVVSCRTKKTRQTFDLVFERGGSLEGLDFDKSDLNGNDVPDGLEKR